MDTHDITIDRPVSAIVMFGPPTNADGTRPGTYWQCVIDPHMCAPSGDYIRFEQPLQGGELHGWQRVDGLTVCEVLGEPPSYKYPEGVTVNEGAKVTMMAIVRE